MNWSAAGVVLAIVVLAGIALALKSHWARMPHEPEAEPTLQDKVRAHRRSKYKNPAQMSGMAGGLFGTGVWAGGDGGGFDGGGGGDGGGS